VTRPDPSSAGPEVSVVVATHRRETRLAFLLEALAGQTLEGGRFEVIVVRSDAPGPRAEPPAALDVRFLDGPAVAGPAELRNIGWPAARAPLVAFTDDDCRPAPGWLTALAEAHAADPEAFLQGPTRPDPDEAPQLYGLARSQAIEGPTPWYETCNIAYPRALLERLGGFDEVFDGGGEDADLGLRAVESGARRQYVPDALVWHAVHARHVWDAVRDARRWHTIPLVVARHPQQRGELELGLFWRAGHPRVLTALAGAALGRGRPVLALAAAAPYLRHHIRGYGRGPRAAARALADLPARAAVDLAGVAATARAAIRHRTAVL
jgi:GT2 family glycosyltransferase